MVLSSILLGIFFLIFFLICLYSGHFDDFESPRIRILIDDIYYYNHNNEKEKNS
ncbi:cbb3-type cytochrome oxidase assembly protein CcoS [Blattabacterium cuenoti]|uniref:cbb3-type cytochrome oxidase assembly protein CcoS n=1 Tax=Blattabacterium cuenoti TaxID=1653831 RepID=UPI001EE9D3EC|nr:cbb3-type cytochrome oxidase assembly protein CcoS [Blattabacterium cuenoti]